MMALAEFRSSEPLSPPFSSLSLTGSSFFTAGGGTPDDNPDDVTVATNKTTKKKNNVQETNSSTKGITKNRSLLNFLQLRNSYKINRTSRTTKLNTLHFTIHTVQSPQTFELDLFVCVCVCVCVHVLPGAGAMDNIGWMTSGVNTPFFCQRFRTRITFGWSAG